MKINRHNYEAFLLDRLEGKLSVEEMQALDQFLALNPDCNSELSQLEPWILSGSFGNLPCPNKELLKKDFPDQRAIPEEHNFDMFSIARMEGDLTDEQVRAHQAMLEEDDQKFLEWIQWQQAKLEAGPLTYAGKTRLKRRKIHTGRMILIPLIAAVAVLALLIILLRTEPDLPQQSSQIQAPQEEVAGENPIVLPEQEVLAAEVEPVTGKKSLRRDDPSEEHPAALEPVPSGESLTVLKVEEKYAVQPEAIAFSARKFNRFSMLTEACYDRIEPLHIDPVPVHLSSLSLAQLSDIGLQEVVEEYAEEKGLSLWKIADSGIKGINKLTGSEISFMASRDEDGDVSGFQLKSKRFSFTRPLSRED